ncbi:hypothetical protein A3E39_01555 [Candidatus Uhrbacteria bacterium RIFCSPHIGHO2_12_FULL_60_25]|uniref:Uncharacterized protein n=1 Tax=Candidatus Uhrbacteria bacterium RIFCSPHIGHO2_12_FULL_60_25 TaxID=1802399 RepID=A0A1F7UJU5_9BACT|nr:MAG: hypothetical protein A3D73_04150 [Candidatus Uhrbacteria bacterium RIFCSPHIGHO2_02_FULL_60_44]OGL78525.1 MAG: hypothetical protein A3E39_01555 [Candidatus Uhrbacteria bacterium RIFCSPHIGHO2_12_FULL_60_25]
MASPEELKALCFDDRGGLKTKPECRSALINHLILDEMMDVMEAEDVTEKTLRDLNLWPVEEKPKDGSPLP